MRHSFRFIVPLFVLVPALLSAKQIAFPGAEGFGRFASGGRGGKVIAVTNLNDNGPGSLRAAIEAEGPRTVVFRVSGTIFLEDALEIKNGDLTIAGQTAPGDGITLANFPLKLDADNVIIRFIRSRLGDHESQEADAFEARYSTNVIIDHCSFSWAVDENATAYNNKDFTMQWCIVSEALHNSVHAKGNHGYGGIWGGKNATFHHNLIAHTRSRTPRFNGARYEDFREWGDGRVDHRNNVIYNWGDNSAYGAEPAANYQPQYNLIGNVYKPGPATEDSKRDRIISPDPNDFGMFSQFFISGNYVFGAPEVSLDNWLGVDGVSSEDRPNLQVDEPFAVGDRREDWELLRFPYDEDGDGELDIFQGYTGIAIDPIYGDFHGDLEEGLPPFDITHPDLLMSVLGRERVSDFVELRDASQQWVLTWMGYYEEASAVYADGTPFIVAEYAKPIRDLSARAAELAFVSMPQTIFPALEAYEQVLAHAGASFPHRDSVDARVIEEVRTGTAPHGNNGHIDSQEEVGGYPDLQSTPAPDDSDEDGMPDLWELARGLNPEDASDRNGDSNGNGYTDLEDYLNELVAHHFRESYSATYAEWVAAAFWDDDSEAGLMEDPDGDGRVNAFEYAFVSNPRRADVPPGEPSVSAPALYDFTYRLGADLAFEVRASKDLDTWQVWWSADEPDHAMPAGWGSGAQVHRQAGMHTADIRLDFTPHPDLTDTPRAPLFWRFRVTDQGADLGD